MKQTTKKEFNFSLNSLILSLIAGLSVKHYSEDEKDENEQCVYMKTPIGIVSFIKPNYILQELKKFVRNKECQNATLNDIENAETFGIHDTVRNPDDSLLGISLDREIIKQTIYNQ